MAPLHRSKEQVRVEPGSACRLCSRQHPCIITVDDCSFNVCWLLFARQDSSSVSAWTCAAYLGSGRRCPWWDPAPNRCVVAGQSSASVGGAQARCWCSRSVSGSQTQPSCRPCGGQSTVCRLAAEFHPLFSNLKKIENWISKRCKPALEHSFRIKRIHLG